MSTPPAPGPTGNPLDEVLRPFVRDPLAFLERMRREHGDVVRLRMFPEMYHLVSDPDEVRRILVGEADRFHPTALDQTPASAPLGVRFHQLARTVFHADGGVAALTPAMVSSIGRALDGWCARRDGDDRLDLAVALDELALGVLHDVLLGGVVPLDVAPLAAAFGAASTAGAVQHNVSVYQRAAGDERRADPAFRAAAAHITATVDQLVVDRRALGAGPDLLGRVVFDRETDAPDRMADDHEVRSSVGVLLIAGHSAPASALTWALHLLAANPGVLARLAAEVHGVLGPRDPDAADLPKLRLTRLVLLEAMRLRPPVWVLAPRVSPHPEVIGGFAIPARSKLLISPWVLHRHPAIWDRPEVFDPDRFTSGEPRAFLPFGAGPWGCVGAQFGLVEARLALAMIVRRFTWAPVDDRPVEPDPQVALTPRGGLRLRLTPRAELTPM